MLTRSRLAAAVLLALAAAVDARAQDKPATPEAHHQTTDGRQYPSLKIAGFGWVNFSDQKHPDGPRGFALGQFVLHMTSELSPRVTFFGELSFTARTDAGTGSPPATGFNTEVERLILRFDHSDQLKISFGRYHTPVNYWNTAYHHGAWLQTTINRPEMVQFGGRFLPVHFVGALVEGSVPAGGWNLGYKAGIGNGRSTVISRGGDAGDVNSHRSTLANLVSKPDFLYGLEFGSAAYFDRITIADGTLVSERIVGAHVAWQKEDPEVIAEFSGVRHEEPGAAPDWSRAYYVQVAYRLAPGERRWKPYFRFEHIGIPSTDRVFAGIPELDGSTIGMRYDASQLAAVKVEYRVWTRGANSVRNHGGAFQVCFTF
jgi:hypothetical protein